MNIDAPLPQSAQPQQHGNGRGGRRRGGGGRGRGRGRGGAGADTSVNGGEQQSQQQQHHKQPTRAAPQPRDGNTNNHNHQARQQQHQQRQQAANPQQQSAAAAAAAAAEDEYGGADNGNGGNSNRGSKAQRGNQRKRNTLVMGPQHDVPHCRIVCDTSATGLSLPVGSRDLIVCPNIFSRPEDTGLYEALYREMKSLSDPAQGGIFDESKLVQPWHGSAHLILNDHLYAHDHATGGKKVRWTEKAPIFRSLVERMQHYFKMRVNATRLNFYPDDNAYKGLHHDAAALKPELAAKQNMTVGLSVGATRSALFELADSSTPTGRTMLELPLADRSVYAFSADWNVLWRHGILQTRGTSYEGLPQCAGGRFSVILWGWVDQETLRY